MIIEFPLIRYQICILLPLCPSISFSEMPSAKDKTFNPFFFVVCSLFYFEPRKDHVLTNTMFYFETRHCQS